GVEAGRLGYPHDVEAGLLQIHDLLHVGVEVARVVDVHRDLHRGDVTWAAQAGINRAELPSSVASPAAARHAVAGLFQQPANLVVGSLGEVVVRGADGPERVGLVHAHHAIGDALEFDRGV